jgi:hypothetical protein
VFFWRGAIFEILRLLKIWKDPKINNTMYKKDMLRDWTFALLSDCTWYLDCPKKNTPTLEFEIWEKHELGFLQGLGALEKETPSKERLGGRRGKRQV